MRLMDTILEKAKKNLQTVVLPESYDERMLFAAEKIVEQGLAKIIILGNPAEILAAAEAKGIKLARRRDRRTCVITQTEGLHRCLC